MLKNLLNIEKGLTSKSTGNPSVSWFSCDLGVRASADLQPRVGMGFIHELLIVRNVLSALKL